MKNLVISRSVLGALWLILLPMLPSGLQAAPPDLTAAGVIAALKTDPNSTPVYGETYNLGSTGLRGWIWIDRNNVGADGLQTAQTRQILVTVASAPGNAVLAVDDVILGAMAGSSGTVPPFSSDARKAFGVAIGDAEKTGAGTLRVKRWRAGTTTDENIPMTVMGDYAATAPYSCPKSTLILANARNKLVSQLDADPNFLSIGWSGAISGLALLAAVEPGYVSPNGVTYNEVQARLQTFARSAATTGPQDWGLPIWDWGYMGLFLAEYYLSTGDTNVLGGIHQYTITLARSQSMYGTFGHGPSVVRPDGTLRRSVAGYGPVNQCGIPANLAIVMGKKALVAAAQPLDPEIDPAIQRGSDFFAWYVNKGSIPYGEHVPGAENHGSNGKDAQCAVLFGLQDNRLAETEYFTRMTTAGFTGREYGHTGQGFSYLWEAMGANMGGALAVAEYLKQVRWHLDLERRTDGSFVYDGAEQYGAGSTANGSYLGESSYYGLNATASYILTYSLPLQRLHITGKNANPANTLDATKVANAIAAATIKQDCAAYTTTQLIAALSEFDPVVRYYAAIELAARSLTSTELTTLRTMVTGTNVNGRMGACQTLGILKDATAMPLLIQRLDKSIETDSWVRAAAASALRLYDTATTSTQLTPLLTAFIANATDPDVIVWSDPLQASNSFLGFALWGDAIYGYQVNGGANLDSSTINAAKNLLYPAVMAGLKQPDSYSRQGASDFVYNKLLLADVRALPLDFINLIQYECQVDRMWSAGSRARGIQTLAKHKIAEGIPLALAMLEVPAGFEWGCGEYLIPALNALATYGDAARWTLPALRGYLGIWGPQSSEYATLVTTIASIEAAITTPVGITYLKAVANSQVVTTTGTKAVTLTGTSCRDASVTFTNVTAPAHGTLTGTAPNLTYTPAGGYTGPDSFTFQTMDLLTTSEPATVSLIVGTAGTGLKGEYFDNIDFTNLKLTRTDAQVNFDWGTGTPSATLGADTFSVRWDGLLLVPETGTYTFSTLNSDGVRLYVNGALLIDDYVDQATNWKDGAAVNLTAGQMVDLHMRYYENTGSAVAKLKWTGPSFAGANGAIIGSQWLYDGTGMTRTPYAHAQSVTLVQNTPKAITLTGSGGTLAYSIITQPAHGTLSGVAPNLTYTPAANYSGSDSFTFLVNNGTSNSSPATVSISIWAGQPVNYTWASAVSGNMSTAARWTPATAPAATGQPYYNLNFTPSGTYTVTHDLNNGFLLNQLNVAGAVTFAGTNSLAFAANGTLLPQFNQNSSNAVTVNTPLSLTAMTNFGGTGGGQMDLASLISGAGGLTKDGAGMLKIHGLNPNTYSGGTIINSGTLHLGTMVDGISPLCQGTVGTGTVTLNGGTIEFDRVSATNALTVNGGTLFSNNGWGSTWSGPVTLNGTATVNAEWNMTFSGNVSGAGGFTKTGGNTLTLSGTNSFTGSSKITFGTLTCSNSTALGTGPLDITSGARVNLNYSGTRTIAALTLNAGAPLAPGTYGSTASPATNKNDTYFSGSGTVTILPATTTTLALTSGSTPADPGTPLTFTATVTGSSPTGNVAFYDSTTLLGTTALNGSYQAAFTTSSLAIGLHGITARYAGNATNATSTSAALPVEIISLLPPAPTNLLAAAFNHHVGLTWTVSAGATSYYVKRALTSGGPYTVIGNPDTASYDDLTAANGTPYYYVVSAINGAGESANSNQVSGTPGPQPSTTTLDSSPVAAGPYGDAVTFTATVTVSGGPATGTVTFKDGTTVLGSGTLDGAGQAIFATSTLAVASHSITATYDGDTTFGGSVSTPTVYQVSAKALTLTGVTASDKVYDKTDTAILTGGAVSGGLVGGETVTVVPGSGSFAGTNAGTWAVTATGYALEGASAGNYVLSAQPSVPNATITPRPLQLAGTRAYDGTATAAAAVLTITNNLDGGDLSLTGSATLAGKDAGARALLAPPARVQSATGSTGTSANTTCSVELQANPLAGNTLIAVIGTRGTSANRVSAISGGGVSWTRVSQAANTGGTTTTEIWYGPNVASGTTTITITQASLRSAAVVIEYRGLLAPTSFDLAANQTGSSTAAVTGTTATTTQPNELWLGGIGIADGRRTLNAPYGNAFTVVASPKSGTTSSDAMIHALEKIVTTTGAAGSGGTLSTTDAWSGAIATFKAAATGSLALTGIAAANYTLTGATGEVAITPKALALTATPAVAAKPYDGLTAATLSGATLQAAEAAGTGTPGDGTPYTGDAVAVVLSGTFDTKDAAAGKPVTSTSSLSGAHKDNYTLTQPAGLTGTITPKALTLTAMPAVTGKPYDGLTAATLTGATLQAAETAGTGTAADGTPYAGDAVTVVLSGTFDTKDAATGKPVTSTSTLDGAHAGNYTLTQPSGLSGTITPADLTITADPQDKTYGQTLAFGSGATQFTSDGLQHGETIGSVTLACAGGDAAAMVASYPITPAAATGGTFSAGNYTINYVPGTLTVNQAEQTITFGALADRTYGDAPFDLTATADSGLTVSYASSDPTVASVSGNTVTVLKAGGTTLTASQPGDANHHPAAPVAQTLTVKPAAPVTFEAWAADPAQGLTAGVNDGPLDDPDHDGLANLLEFVLGGGPMVSSQEMQPRLTHTGGIWVFSYDRSGPSKSSTTQVVEHGSDLTGWTPLTIPADSAGDVTITPGTTSDHVEVAIPAPGARGFARLKVSQHP